ncbi:MAG: hypothetical protein Q7S07_04490 [Candidatus Omnitrophota bacterium]|nr:hypothetical protein [Candidatus Omnitrophota bacterium]
MKKENIIMVCVGASAGSLLTFSPFGSLVFSAFLLCLYFIYRYSENGSRAFLIKLFVIGFLIRIPLVILNYFIGLQSHYNSSDTQPDAMIYNANAFYLAQMISNLDFSKDIFREPFLADAFEQRFLMYNGGLPSQGTYQFGAYVKFIGFLYSWLGYSPIAAKLLNGLAGCISAILAYALAKVLTGDGMTAKISAFLVMFFPSSLYWSVTLLQDPLVNCLFLLYALMAILYLKNGNKGYILSMLISCVIISSLKTRLPLLLWSSFAIFLTIKFFVSIARKKVLTRSMILLILFIFIASGVVLGQKKIAGFLEDNVKNMFFTHKSAATDYPTASTFKLYGEDVYNKKLLTASDVVNSGIFYTMFKAAAYYFLSPFPWDISRTHPYLLLFYPQIIFTFICLPFMFIGILNCVKRAPLITISLIALIILLALPQAMSEGIIGNVVRHRDMFMSFILIFSVYGFCVIASRSEPGRELP